MKRGVKGQRKEKSVWNGQETGKDRREEDSGVGWGKRSRAEDVMRKTPCYRLQMLRCWQEVMLEQHGWEEVMLSVEEGNAGKVW